MSTTRDLIALLAIKGIGPAKAKGILEGLNIKKTSGASFLPRVPDLFPAGNINMSDIGDVSQYADEVLKNAKQKKIRIITHLDKKYPEALRYISNAPLVLYYKGDISSLNLKPSIAVVGTRFASAEGLKIAGDSARQAVKDGFVVVSGLAAGCDTAAHKATLAEKGITIAVVAHGPDLVFPKENKCLAEDILKNKGAILSEYPPGVGAERHHFVQRDRIQSGLSSGVFIVESDIEGGAMYTAEFALQQRRVLGCWVFKNASKVNCSGNQQLLHEKRATPVASEMAFKNFLVECKKQKIKKTEELFGW